MSALRTILLAKTLLRRATFTGVLLAAAALAVPAAAQAPAEPAPGDSLLEMRRSDGFTLVGRILEEDGDEILFQALQGGRVRVKRGEARFRPARGRLVDGEFWAADRNGTRLFFAPTGRTLEAGAGYAGLFLLVPFVGYGVTDGVTVAGGMPIVGALGETPAWLAPKARLHHSSRTQLSAGVFAIHLPTDEPDDCSEECSASGPGASAWNGVAYGVGTFGDEDNALHVGAGYTFGEGAGETPVMVGGEWRLSRMSKVITENWLIPGQGGAASLGMRRLGERWTFDYGLMFLFGEGVEEIPYFPILSVSYAFGGGR